MRRIRHKSKNPFAIWLVPLCLAAACICAISILLTMDRPAPAQRDALPTASPPPASIAVVPTATAPLPEAATPEPTPFFTASASADDAAKPSLVNLRYRRLSGDTLIDSYRRDTPLYFGAPQQYSSLEGVITFRGDHFRSGGSYGSAALANRQLGVAWRKRIGAIDKWTGVGWN
ncbi:MAG: hypothetical protein ACLSX2_07805, partial [Christensenellaceae bacterium]